MQILLAEDLLTVSDALQNLCDDDVAGHLLKVSGIFNVWKKRSCSTHLSLGQSLSLGFCFLCSRPISGRDAGCRREEGF